MCFYDADGPECFREWHPVARKEHRCCECADTIAVGTRHYTCSGVWDGTPMRFRICPTCERARDIVEEHEHEEGCTGTEAICPYGFLGEYLAELNEARFTDEVEDLDAEALVIHGHLGLALALQRAEVRACEEAA